MQGSSYEPPSFDPGWVWLAGAGPGDPGLLTLHALHGLQHADIVVYDALVGKGILDLAGAAAVLEYAGKRGGRPSSDQHDISRRLVALARENKRVLRLKGGDPLVFGRGAEEALALVAADVPFRLIPGITAGTGALAYAGIPLTHRETNSVVSFITGHGAAGGVPGNVDWEAVSRGSSVLVVYMPLRQIGAICDRLLAAGRAPTEPVAVIGRATMAEQTVVETTLAACAADTSRNRVEPPAIVVVGEVVRLRAGLDWLGALAGRTLIADPLSSDPGGDGG